MEEKGEKVNEKEGNGQKEKEEKENEEEEEGGKKRLEQQIFLWM